MTIETTRTEYHVQYDRGDGIWQTPTSPEPMTDLGELEGLMRDEPIASKRRRGWGLRIVSRTVTITTTEWQEVEQ